MIAAGVHPNQAKLRQDAGEALHDLKDIAKTAVKIGNKKHEANTKATKKWLHEIGKDQRKYGDKANYLKMKAIKSAKNHIVVSQAAGWGKIELTKP